MEAKGVIVILGIVVVLILAGCQQKIICKSPYLLVGQECCLDKDANGICDKDEQSAEPKTVVVSKPEVIEVQKYVCSDGKIVSNPKDCPVEKPAPEKEMSLPALITTTEEDTVILNFSVSPACKSGENGGEVFFKLGSIPEKVWLQARQGNDAYSTIFTREGVYEKYLSFVICDGCAGKGTDFTLKPDALYVIRGVFNQTVYDRMEYSNEHLVDTRASSPFIIKKCR